MTPIVQARNLGPVTSRELRELGIETLAQLRREGWESVFRRWTEAFPERVHETACRALAGAVEACDWRLLPPDLLADVRRVVAEVRAARR
jgi:hypothetical protein